MTNYQRITAKVFGETATATGNNPEIGQFGSALAGTYVGTTDVSTIQSLTAWSDGFIGCVTPTDQFPPLPELTGFGKVLSQQQAYLLQKGIPEWDSGTTYYLNDYCRIDNVIYYSLQDNNLNQNPASATSYWTKAVNNLAWTNWNSDMTVLTTVTAVGNYDIDLSSILPSDNYNYECVLRYFAERRDANSNDTTYGVYAMNDKVWLHTYVEGDQSLSTNYRRISGQIVVVVGTNRKIKLKIANINLHGQELDLIMYRNCGR